MDLNTDQLLRVAFDTATADQADLPDGLGERVLASAVARAKPLQHPAWADPDRAPGGPLRAFIKTTAELADLLATLEAQDWACVTRADHATVRDLVEHLVGVERYVLGQLGRRPRLRAPRREDHWPVAKLAAAELANEPSEFVARTWWLEVLDVVAACGELGPDYQVAYHHLSGSLRGLLVVRTFELWTHGDDIRQATNQPLNLLDESRLSLMVNELMRVLPLGLALSGCPQPGRTARLKLTGLGGGSFDVALAPGEPLGEPDITLTAYVIDLCRLASNRLAREEFDVGITGDRGLLEPILDGATAFAAD
jgi:uncharacterized protein (TIGR03083 family)